MLVYTIRITAPQIIGIQNFGWAKSKILHSSFGRLTPFMLIISQIPDVPKLQEHCTLNFKRC